MKYTTLLLSLMLSKCNNSSSIPSTSSNNLNEKEKKKEEENKFIQNLFSLLENDKIDKFKNEIDKASKNQLDIIKQQLLTAIKKDYKGTEIENSNKLLFCAISIKSLDLVKKLVEKNANLCYKLEGKIPLEYSKDNGSQEITEYLENLTEEMLKNYDSKNKLINKLMEIYKNGNITFGNVSEIEELVNNGAIIDKIEKGKEVDFFNLVLEKVIRIINNEVMLTNLINILDILNIDKNIDKNVLSIAFHKVFYLSYLLESFPDITSSFLNKNLDLKIKVKEEGEILSIFEHFLIRHNKFFLHVETETEPEQKKFLIEISKRKNIEIDLSEKNKMGVPLIFSVLDTMDKDIIKAFFEREPKIINLKNNKEQSAFMYLYKKYQNLIIEDSPIIELLESSYKINLEERDNEGNSFYDVLLCDRSIFSYHIIMKLIERERLNINFILQEINYKGEKVSVIEKLVDFSSSESILAFGDDVKESKRKLQSMIVNLIKEKENQEGNIGKEVLNKCLFELLKYDTDIKLLEAFFRCKNTDLNYKIGENNLTNKSLLTKFIIYIKLRGKGEEILINLIKDNNNNIESINLNESLFEAIYIKNLNLVKAIVEKGADLTYQKNFGKMMTPIEYSKTYSSQEISDYLIKK